MFFFFNDTATTEIYTLSLHDALPISWTLHRASAGGARPIPSSAGRAYHHRPRDRKSTRLNSSHGYISYAVFCLKKKKKSTITRAPARRMLIQPCLAYSTLVASVRRKH